MDKYYIASTGNSINYLPQYIAEKKGFFEEQNLLVKTSIPNPWPLVLDEIDEKRAEVVCGGIWVPSMYHHHNIKKYSCFAQISSLCPFKLVARDKEKDFSFKDLEGKTVLVPCDGGASAYIFLVGTLKDKGVDVKKVKFIHDFVDSMLYAGFTKGDLGDYYFTQAAKADLMVAENKAKVVSMMAVDAEKVPWSIYYSTKEVAKDEKKLNHRFALAIQKGIDYLLSHEGKDFIDILKERWPNNDTSLLVETVDEFIKLGMWSSSIRIDKEKYEHYARYQIDAGIIDSIVEYEDLVDTSVLEYVEKNK